MVLLLVSPKAPSDGSGCRHADGGYFGLVKHAEQVRYEPREASQRTPFWIGFGMSFTRESACHFGLTLQEPHGW